MTILRKKRLHTIVCNALRLLIGLFMLLLLLPAAASAESDSESYPFSKGSARISFIFGSGTAFDHEYTILGLGGGYFVADGLEVGLDVETWTGNSPRIHQISPQARVVFNMDGPVKPYAGVFYRRTIIESYRDSDAIGARAGLYFLVGKNFYVGAGVAHDVRLNCDRTVFSHCSETYPEVLVAIVF